ncbi:MAG: ABC transporter ATP-binding protein [Velocimicrobium sp.]
MKKLLRFLKYYKKESILAPLFKMLEASFELMVPIVMAYIIDVGIVNQDRTLVLGLGGVLVLLGVIGLICSITAQYFSAKAAVGFAGKLRHALFLHIQGLSYNEMDQIGSATLITRITSDINQLQTGVNMVLRLFLRSPFIVFGAMIMAFTIDAKIAIIFAVMILLLSLIIYGIMGISIPLYNQVQKNLDQVLSILRENLSGVRVVRAFNIEEREIERFEKQNKGLMKQQVFVGRISALMNPITYVIVNISLIVLIYTGAFRVDSGILTQGQVIALVSYMSQILVELIKMANLIITIMKAVACGNRVQAIFEMQTSMQNQGSEELVKTSQSVVFDHVSFAYPNAKEYSLTDISFTSMVGETIGIIGGTGSGKSTLVQLIPRLYDVTSGVVELYGKGIGEYRIEELREKISLVLQKATLFHGTVRENIQWGKENASDADIMEALEVAQASNFVSERKEGLDFEIEQEGQNLSGGQKQRLSIARSWIKKPNILILDDSASALDFTTEAKLRASLRKKKEDQTVFIVSQRISSIQYADQILVLEDGKLVGCGSHKQLLTGCSVYQEIYESQVSSH